MSKFSGILQARRPRQRGETAEEPKRGGRPRGKASDPNYRQVTLYLRRDMYTEARKRLLDEEVDLSELVNGLIGKWLATPARKEK